ncbi:hypothetical protein [Salinibaculum rarum]|uniref:hypothetical protein n=1 Tax=Salinibaculum rarum TaxID=3058903 RepID=UPI00265F0F38|nr:hypothetical protein [Salinibaculum sp. KK48]
MGSAMRTERIGSVIAYELSEGDNVTLTTADSDQEWSGTIIDDGSTPIETGQETEVVCDLHDSEDVLTLHARVTHMCEMHAEFDVYALLLTETAHESLGEITTIRITE